MPLNYNYQIDRMTQLFGRPLFIRYFKKDQKENTDPNAQQYIGLDGEIAGPANIDGENFGGDDPNEEFEAEVGFDEGDLPD